MEELLAAPCECPGAEVWFLLQRVFTLAEVERLTCGDEEVDVKSWRSCTVYEGYGELSDVTAPQTEWFWEVVESFTTPERAELLAWARGSSALPPTGFQNLTFTLRRDTRGAERLPVAHTCEFSVDLPDYATKSTLEGKLRYAMKEVRFGTA